MNITTKQKKELLELFAKMCCDFMDMMDKYFTEKRTKKEGGKKWH